MQLPCRVNVAADERDVNFSFLFLCCFLSDIFPLLLFFFFMLRSYVAPCWRWCWVTAYWMLTLGHAHGRSFVSCSFQLYRNIVCG